MRARAKPKSAQVRELQRATGATVKIPEETPAPVADNNQQPAEATSSGSDQGGDKVTAVVNGADAVVDVELRAPSPTTVVRISGTFAAVQVGAWWLCACAHTQAVQARLRHMVYQFTQLSPPMKLMSP